MSDERILSAAKSFMLAYLGDGRVRRPVDFDEEIMGGPSLDDLMMLRSPSWNASVFCEALGELVDAGRVRAWQNDDGEWFYQMSGVPIQ